MSEVLKVKVSVDGSSIRDESSTLLKIKEFQGQNPSWQNETQRSVSQYLYKKHLDGNIFWTDETKRGIHGKARPSCKEFYIVIGLANM